ncbi:hypothetical protein GCM10007100_34730 [Roseibacillus persicicus]|uniref:Uncharacterized protein n=1 Tax=Roseibacillus persicicus TaxID=454148 RepID=A0A918WPJ7_9BACT|nr:hypothetical protein GCM10007100_34730 [Roseibacillus persicicus]
MFLGACLGTALTANAADIDVIATQTAVNATYGLETLAGNTTWTADNVYILTDRLYVPNGLTLTIEPGTKIYSTFDDKGTTSGDSATEDDSVGALIVARGGQLIANGTAAQPIVFDALQTLEAERGVDLSYDSDSIVGPAPTATTSGLWGGVIILGNAYVARTDENGENIGDDIIEGFTPAGATDTDDDGSDILEYGYDAQFARDDADDSGVLRYVSIRHGGYSFGPDNEINGLTLGGVGNGTTIEYVEVVANNDDGVEFFGGTVNTNNIVVAFANDDSFDIDQGHSGTHQFWFAIQNPNAGDNLGEWDGIDGVVKNVNGSGTVPANDVLASAPQIFNATFVGPGADAFTNSNVGKDNALYLDDSFNGALYNSILHDSVNFVSSFASDGANAAVFSHNIVGELGRYSSASSDLLEAAPSDYYLDFLGNVLDNNTEAETVVPFADYTRDGSSYLQTIDPRPAMDCVEAYSVAPGAPQTANYRGAFGSENWALGWTWMDAQGYFTEESTGGNAGIVDVISTQTALNSTYGLDTLAEDTTWSKENVYVLTDRLYVPNGLTLTIEPGTKIYSTFDDKGTTSGDSATEDDSVGALIVARGGQLIANGTAAEPIIFDALQSLEAECGMDLPYDSDSIVGPAPTATTSGLWGGVIVLGNAYVARTDENGENIGDDIIEGFTPAGATDTDDDGSDILEYGYDAQFARDDADDSGILRYVSIRHGGYSFGPDNEINGLTLGGVGNGTTIEYVEVVANNDDGVEFFGGTVNTNNIVVAFANDDSFDIDQGHSGTHQFWFAIQNPNAGDNLGEWDGIDGVVKNVNGSGTVPANDVLASAPQIYNATLVGPGADAFTNSNVGKDNALYLDDSFNGALYNSILHDSVNFVSSFASDGANAAVFSHNIVGELGRYSSASSDLLEAAPSDYYLDFLGNVLDNNTEAETVVPFADYTRDSSSYLQTIDPRPAMDCVEAYSVAPGAPQTANYRGAFGSENWALGWTWMDTQGYFTEQSTGGNAGIVDVIGTQTAFNATYGLDTLAGDTTWGKENVFVLTDRLYVPNGLTLTIEPGTKIYSTFDDKGTTSGDSATEDDSVGAIIVARGGKIYANGTASEPIIFDALQTLEAEKEMDLAYDADSLVGPAPTATTSGLWGGVIVLGNAYVARTDENGENIGDDIIEGFTPAGATDTDDDGSDILEYGYDAQFARDDADDSGVLRYVSIRHGGYSFGPDNEINGLTLGGVGNGTTIEYVEVVANNDDGVEFFGGTVNTNNIVVAFANDDSFDIDQGHSGTHQFWFAIQNPNAGDNLGEWDGIDGVVKNVNGSGTVPANDVLASAPQIYNATLVGPGADAFTNSNVGKDNALYLDDSFNGALYNSILHDSVNFVSSFASDGANAAVFSHNTVGELGRYSSASSDLLEAAPSDYYLDFLGNVLDNNTEAETDPQFGFYVRDGGSYLVAIDPRSSSVEPVIAGAPVVTDYRGAFGSENWALGWTWMDANNYFTLQTVDNDLEIVSSEVVGGDFIINFKGAANTTYAVTSDTDLQGFETSEGTVETDASGNGTATVSAGEVKKFVRIEEMVSGS